MTIASKRPSNGRIRRLAPALSIVAATLILAGCGERPLSTFGNESPIAEDLSSLLNWLLIVCGIVFVLVQGIVIYMSRKFAVDTPENDDDVYPDDEFPEQVHGNTRLEIGWTIAPFLIMVVVAIFSVSLHIQLDEVSASEQPQRIEHVDVVGQQWWWEFQYYLTPAALSEIGANPTLPGPHIVTAGELPLPVGEEIQLHVTSRDVIHSFWVPALNGKRDAVPGLTSPWTIETNSVGRFPGECTEFCGLSHAYMEKWAIGLEWSDWNSWAEGQVQDKTEPTSGTEAEGWTVFETNCASCHVINGITSLREGDATDNFRIYDGANRLIPRNVQVSGAAPNLTHVMSRSTFGGGIFELYEHPDDVPYNQLAEDGDLNRGDLEAWIVNSPGVKANASDVEGAPRGMPARPLSDEDLEHLIDFLLTLD